MLYRIRLGEVASWPVWELDLLEHYLAREPAPDERLEIAVARLTAIFASVHKKENAPQPKVSDFLPYLKAWPDVDMTDGRYNEIDQQVLAELL